jgi:transposase
VSNYLDMKQRQHVIALLELGWTYRRIERETGVRRETISRYDGLRRANPAKVFAGSGAGRDILGPGDGGSDPKAAKVFPGSGSNPAKAFPDSTPPARSAAAPYRDTILEKLEAGMTLQRIWQDLVEEYGYGHSYESVKRYARVLDRPKRPVGVYHHAPGEEAQVDFFQGAPTFRAEAGRWERPWVFRMTLCHSRHGYEEAAWNQKLGTFLRLHENAFRDLGGVPRVLRHDNLKAAVVRACLFDPDSHPVYEAFARHWGFTPLPTRPVNPQENGKQERSGGYVKSNALKGRRFESLSAKNDHLRHWNRTWARLRIHGTTRRQVWGHFLESDRPALQPLPPEPFPLFSCGHRTVHRDGHVEVEGAFYPAPPQLLGERIQVRWDERLVRLIHRDHVVAVHARVSPGSYAPGGAREPIPSQKVYLDDLLGRCERVGMPLRQWAEEALSVRGVRAIRLIQGALALGRTVPRERLLRAAEFASRDQLYRYHHLKQLVDPAAQTESRILIADHPAIRPLTDYRLEDYR